MPLNLFKKRAVAGIDIGHHSIKLVMAERGPSGWRITQANSVPTPPESIRESIVVDQDAVSGALKQLLREAGAGSVSANIAVSGGSVVVRTVRIPKMPEATLRKSIKFEAGRYVPTSVDDSFIEFEVVGETEEQQMDVLIVAAPRDVVESRLEACRGAGLEVVAVDIEPFAAYRSLIEADPAGDWDSKTLAMIDVGAATTNVSVISKGQFSMTRTINQGGETLTEALKNYFKLSAEHAEAGKSQLDFRQLLSDKQPQENPPLRVLQPHVDDLIREMRRSLNYFQSQQTDATGSTHVDMLVVTGGGSSLPGLAEYVGDKLAIPVVSSGIFDNPRFTFSGTAELGKGLDLSVASGLAMRSQGLAA